MRIGIDVMGAQAPESRGRGIGRYTGDLVSQLIAQERGHQYFLYQYEGLPPCDIARSQRTNLRQLRGDRAPLAAVTSELVHHNPDALDLLLISSPFGRFRGYAPPAKPLGPLKLAAIVYDVIPAVFQQQYLRTPELARWYYQTLETLGQYDLLLAISEATKADCHRLLPSSRTLMVNVGSACDRRLFVPEVDERGADRRCDDLSALGVREPYVFSVGGGLEWRKNYRGLLEAFALLPARVRDSHQLVVTCALSDREIAAMRQLAASHGISDRLVLTNYVSDSVLQLLYQRCAAFVFPSIYEGFGLPILEAMHCGAAVIAGNNSSQIEIVGDAGLLANAHDAADLSAKLNLVLQHEELANTLRARAAIQARKFDWNHTADRCIEAIRTTVHSQPTRVQRLRFGPRPKQRLAFFSPLPPKQSGVSDYSVSLIRKLTTQYAIDLFHDSDYLPHESLRSPDLRCFDYRLFDRFASVVDYTDIVYQMGNSEYHRFVYETMQRHPGIVTLHDLSLAGFHRWYAGQPGIADDHLRKELSYEGYANGSAVASILENCPADRGKIYRACVREGIYLNRRVLDIATHIIVHSPWSLAKVRNQCSQCAQRTSVIPLGTTVETRSAAQRSAIRCRFGIPRDALVYASFGGLHATKLNSATIAGFASVAATYPQAQLLFVGTDMDDGSAREAVRRLRLGDRVRFIGHLPNIEDFRDLATVTDIAVNLRKPPTNGESSATLLLLLGAGVATVVTDVDTASAYPDDVVLKIAWANDFNTSLEQHLLKLADDSQLRSQLGASAQRYVRTFHTWSRVAGLYIDVINRAAALRRERATRSYPIHSTLSHDAADVSMEALQPCDREQQCVIGPTRVHLRRWANNS